MRPTRRGLDVELIDNRALVTGGGRGIGRAISLALARQGAKVALLARTGSELDQVAGEIAELGRESLVVQADLADDEELHAGVTCVLEEWQGLDILVNNAGILGPIGMAHTVDPEAWMHAVKVNLGGCFLCTHLALSGMVAQGRGKIINLSGGGAVSPRPYFGAYSASKAGVVRFTETLAAEVGDFGVHVNAIAPGAVNTAMLDEALAAGPAAGEQGMAEALQQQADGGVDPERAAALAVFLASPRSDGLTGRLISAVWDRWEDIDIEAVMQTEAYTVRRLKPES